MGSIEIGSRLDWPFDSEWILANRRAIRRELSAREGLIPKKIAILGGSTTNDIAVIMALFLMNYGIRPEFYQSEYAQYWQDAMFDNPELVEFAPDIIFIHTSSRNITAFPALSDEKERVDALLESQFEHFSTMWDRLAEKYHCPIIQNNFEPPLYRLMGNRDASDIHGRTNFIARLNLKFYEYAQTHENFFINDINYLASSYGLEKWSDPGYWYMYKYALALEAIDSRGNRDDSHQPDDRNYQVKRAINPIKAQEEPQPQKEYVDQHGDGEADPVALLHYLSLPSLAPDKTASISLSRSAVMRRRRSETTAP